jgi:hypothetical protein
MVQPAKRALMKMWGFNLRQHHPLRRCLWKLFNPTHCKNTTAGAGSSAAAVEADAREHERKSEASKRAVQTRRAPQEARIHLAARRIVSAMSIDQQRRCYCCGKALTDSESNARGIGSECWQRVLDAVGSIEKEEKASPRLAVALLQRANEYHTRVLKALRLKRCRH